MNPYIQLTPASFEKLKRFIYETSAINLSDKKFSLVQSRLQKRVKTLQLQSFDAYYDYLCHHQDEVSELIDAISTNVTTFFREERQWHYLKENMSYLQELLKARRKLTIWSAACSSGQEPYSIAMYLLQHLPNVHSNLFKILATDISTDILKKAIAGQYAQKEVEGMDALFLKSYFERKKNSESSVTYRISDEVRKLILFRQFNLTRGDYTKFSGKQFDIIFCRNVMIYFDTPTRMALLERFHALMHDKSILFLGHSETITSELLKKFKLIRPSIYRAIK